MSAKSNTKTIRLLLFDGTLDGLLMVEDNSWTGRMLVSPRESIGDMLARDDVNRYGIYVLLSEREVYIGQASDLKKRISQHYGAGGKDWWTRAVLLTTKDDSLTRSDIDFLESRLIDVAESLDTLHVDNRARGNRVKVDEFRENELTQYLDNAKLLLELIGITVFARKVKKRRVRVQVGVQGRGSGSGQRRARGLERKREPDVNRGQSRKQSQTQSGGRREQRERDVAKLLGKVFYIKGKSKQGAVMNARVKFVSEDEFVLLKGSTIHELSKFRSQVVTAIEVRRDACAQHLSGLEVTDDIAFESLNRAARFVAGQAADAWVRFKDEEGRTIDEIARE
ncbi:MAG: GIY-YIG nuclease family protein [Actinomycetes bacterium]|nr:GIY-YIG nuclease family protein [Actinomycetes bacterium]